MIMPFPIIGVDSDNDNGSEFINHHPARLVQHTRDHLHPLASGQQQRRRPRRAEELGDRAHRGRLPPLRHPGRTGAAEQDLGAAVAADQLLLPAAEADLQVRNGAKVIKKYDRATTPHRRAADHDGVSAEDKIVLAETYTTLNPAAAQRQIQALTDRLLKITTSKAHPAAKPSAPGTRTRASAHESTKPATRAS